MAYAAVVSLVQSLSELLHSTDDQTSKPLIESLYAKLCSLKSSLEKILPAPKIAWIATNDLETKIRDTVYKAQDTIEKSLISCQSLSLSVSLVFLQETVDEVDSFTKTIEEIEVFIKEGQERDGDLTGSENALPSVFGTSWSRDEIVGQDKNLKMLKALLLEHNPTTATTDLDVVPIVGMVGIGKTTLAKCIYDDPHVRESFPYRGWVTVSPEYRVGGVFISLISGMESTRGQGTIKDTLMKTYRGAMRYDYLRDMLHKLFYQRKYLLVIDDVLDHDVWEKLRITFPDNKNGSRIILTTTNANLASYACIYNYMLRDPFLDDDESWNLLRKVVFTNDSASSPSGPLEIIGRKIAKSCEGLPLAIIEIGKILRGTEKTVQKWKEVEESENPLVIGADDNSPLSMALYWSYKRLPPYLKACFLYMGILPRNTGIRTSELIKLWVAEGFIEHRKNLEKKAEKCLDELVSRSLVLVRKHSFSGRPKTCGMHFLFRSLCITEAPKEDFFHIIKKLYADGLPQGTINGQQQRLCFHNNIVFGFKQVHESLESNASTRSLLCLGPHHPYPVHVYLPFRLLRVLNLLTLRFYEFPNQVLGLVRLRYLAITYDNGLPPSISRLFNLEVLIVRRHHIIISTDDPINYLPIEIWNLHRLKHLHCMGYDLPDPLAIDGSIFLENLLTLSGVSTRSCTEGVLKRMPKLTKVGIWMVQSTHNHAVGNFDFFINFGSLYYNFDSFKYVVVNPVLRIYDFVYSDTYQYIGNNVRKITLSGCGFPWNYMGVIACLPNLRVLKLRQNAFQGEECDLSSSIFWRLRFLLLEDLDLERWIAGLVCFQALERLIIRHCYKLQAFDPRLFDVIRLGLLEVDNCSVETEDWAREMEKRKNDGQFRVQIHSSRDGNNNNKA
ncbi:hypothetical protein CASFOL_027950 [Castilleja foliolosa]|uniref:NB-ARC domain-containing protein n=1 Tax=Castilleja foliolosa TaxID=1961234 RepID=A0ABD3CHA0_9LAMI